MYKYLLFPYQVLEFTSQTFEPLLLEMSHGYSDKTRIDFIKHLAHRVGCFILPKYMMKSYCAVNTTDDDQQLPQQMTDYFKEVIEKFNLDDEPEQTTDYFGILKDMDIEVKKSLALETYKLIFRFSIEKLTKFLDDDSFILLFLQYIKETQLKRVHQR